MRFRRPSERATGAIVVAAVVLGGMAIGTINRQGVGEFAGMGLVYGHIIFERCDRHTPPRCHRGALPRESASAYSTVRGVEVGRAGRVDFGVEADGDFGDGFVSPGRYRYAVPSLERASCRPEPTFRIQESVSYEVVFHYTAPGHCSAVVWARPFGSRGDSRRRLVTEVGSPVADS